MRLLALALVLITALLGDSARADGDPADDTPALDAHIADEETPADPIDADATPPPDDDGQPAARDPETAADDAEARRRADGSRPDALSDAAPSAPADKRRDDLDGELNEALDVPMDEPLEDPMDEPVDEPLVDHTPPPTAEQLPASRRTLREVTRPNTATPPPPVHVPPWRPNAWQQSGAVGLAAAAGVFLGALPVGVLAGASASFIPILNLLRGNNPAMPLVLTGNDASTQSALFAGVLYSLLLGPLLAIVAAGGFASILGWLVGDVVAGIGAGAAAAGAIIPAMIASAFVALVVSGSAAIGLLVLGGPVSPAASFVAAGVFLVGWPTVFMMLEAGAAALAAVGGYWGIKYARRPLLNDDSKAFYELDDPDTDLLPDSSFDLRASPAWIE